MTDTTIWLITLFLAFTGIGLGLGLIRILRSLYAPVDEKQALMALDRIRLFNMDCPADDYKTVEGAIRKKR